MEFKVIFSSIYYVHYDVLKLKNIFFEIILPFFSAESALKIPHFHFLSCFLNADFLVGVVSGVLGLLHGDLYRGVVFENKLLGHHWNITKWFF